MGPNVREHSKRGGASPSKQSWVRRCKAMAWGPDVPGTGPGGGSDSRPSRPPPPPPLHDAGLGPSATNGDIRGTAPTPPPAQSRHRDYEGMPRTEREGGVGTRPWWLALLPCGGAYWPLALGPSAMTSRHPHYCGHPHCRGHPPAWGGTPWRPPLMA